MIIINKFLITNHPRSTHTNLHIEHRYPEIDKRYERDSSDRYRSLSNKPIKPCTHVHAERSRPVRRKFANCIQVADVARPGSRVRIHSKYYKIRRWTKRVLRPFAGRFTTSIIIRHRVYKGVSCGRRWAVVRLCVRVEGTWMC